MNVTWGHNQGTCRAGPRQTKPNAIPKQSGAAFLVLKIAAGDWPAAVGFYNPGQIATEYWPWLKAMA